MSGFYVGKSYNGSRNSQEGEITDVISEKKHRLAEEMSLS